MNNKFITETNQQNDLTLFTDNYTKVLQAISSHTIERDLRSGRLKLDVLHLDKWDIISGIILAGAVTALVVGVSLATYYIVVALCNAGIIAFASALITAKMKDNFAAFIKTEMGWLFEEKSLELKKMTQEKIKDLHSKIKEFLIKHFDNDTNKINDVLKPSPDTL